MKERKNCWEFKKCGREPGGSKTEELGICPAATEKTHNGVNKGEASGRFCWTVAGTFCKGEVQGTFAKKFKGCIRCDFFEEVQRHEARDFILNEKELSKEKRLFIQQYVTA